MTIPALLLTGGSSRRMGRDKATVVFRGGRICDRLATLLEDHCGPVLEVGPGFTTLASIRENPPGSGPLAAIAAGAEALGEETARGAIVIAVDMPLIDGSVIEFLLEQPEHTSTVPVIDGKEQSLSARYSIDALRTAIELASKQERSMKALLREIDVNLIDEAALPSAVSKDAFVDIDTPEELDRLSPK